MIVSISVCLILALYTTFSFIITLVLIIYKDFVDLGRRKGKGPTNCLPQQSLYVGLLALIAMFLDVYSLLVCDPIDFRVVSVASCDWLLL